MYRDCGQIIMCNKNSRPPKHINTEIVLTRKRSFIYFIISLLFASCPWANCMSKVTPSDGQNWMKYCKVDAG